MSCGSVLIVIILSERAQLDNPLVAVIMLEQKGGSSAMFRTKEVSQGLVYGLILLMGAVGCGQKEYGELAPTEEPTTSESATMTEPAPGVTVVSSAVRQPGIPSSQTSPRETVLSSTFTPLPQNPFERNKTIQVALKQAGYYAGNIDGKAGPLTKKAIEDFQKAQGLKVDGKVGPITWEALERYLPESESL